MVKSGLNIIAIVTEMAISVIGQTNDAVE